MADGELRRVDLPLDLHEFLNRYDNRTDLQLAEDLALLKRLIQEAQAEAQGRFTVSEALLLCEALVKELVPSSWEGGPAGVIRRAVAQAIRDDHLDRKWGVDPLALSAKLEPITLAEALAVWDWVRRFWVNPDWDHGKVAALFRCAEDQV
jgi:hypothetical protein